MGAWGDEPWDNDSAADFFGGLWDGTPIVERTLEALRSDDGEVMVAAIWLCRELCRVYVWPIEAYDETLDAAVAAADRILAGEDDDGYLEMWDDDPDIVARITALRADLAERRRGPAAD